MIRELKRRRQVFEKRRHHNRLRLGEAAPKTKRKRNVLPKYAATAPPVFSLIENPDGTIAFLNELIQEGRTRHLSINLRDVKVLTPEAISAFTAVMQSLDCRVEGNQPLDPTVRETMHTSGFFEHVKGVVQEGKSRGKLRMESKSDQVRSDLAAELTDFATTQLHGQPTKDGPTYSTFMETMGNTWDHAAGSGKKQEWWASAYFDERKGRVCFTVVDLGVGIFESITLRQRLEFFKGGLFAHNGEKLHRLLKGEIPSRTGEAHRGRGLPDTYDKAQRGLLDNLVIIANDAYGNARTQDFRKLSNSFSGTLIYWEISR